MRAHLFPVILVLTAASSGCATVPAPAPAPPCPPVEPPPTVDPWRASILDAAVIEADEAIALAPVEGDTLTVITWTKFPDSFKPGEDLTLGWGETWVTVDGALQERCASYDAATLTTDIQQLLGLPAKEEDRFVVTMEVPTEALFRPCADPDIHGTACPATFPEGVTAEHRAWFAGQVSGSYQLPGGYPWTRLGYTYNWKPGAGEVGLMELVIRKGATARVVDVKPTAEYCGK